MKRMTPEERKHIADLLWVTIRQLRDGQTNYWIEQQLLLIARQVEGDWPVSKPINERLPVLISPRPLEESA